MVRTQQTLLSESMNKTLSILQERKQTLKDACSLESYDKPSQHIKKQRYLFANKRSV